VSDLVSQVASLSEEDQINFFVEALGQLTLGACTKLVPILEEKWGVEAKPDFGGVPTLTEEVEEQEQSEFAVVLESIGSKKIQVIKAVRAYTMQNLKDAKGLVDQGGVLKDKLAKEDAERFKALLEEAGATAKIQ